MNCTSTYFFGPRTVVAVVKRILGRESGKNEREKGEQRGNGDWHCVSLRAEDGTGNRLTLAGAPLIFFRGRICRIGNVGQPMKSYKLSINTYKLISDGAVA